MSRRTFVAELRNVTTRQTIDTATKPSWNGAIRASEALAREYARSIGQSLTGGDPSVYGPVAQPGSTYRRTWNAPGVALVAEIVEVTS